MLPLGSHRTARRRGVVPSANGPALLPAQGASGVPSGQGDPADPAAPDVPASLSSKRKTSQHTAAPPDFVSEVQTPDVARLPPARSLEGSAPSGAHGSCSADPRVVSTASDKDARVLGLRPPGWQGQAPGAGPPGQSLESDALVLDGSRSPRSSRKIQKGVPFCSIFRTPSLRRKPPTSEL